MNTRIEQLKEQQVISTSPHVDCKNKSTIRR